MIKSKHERKDVRGGHLEYKYRIAKYSKGNENPEWYWNGI